MQRRRGFSFLDALIAVGIIALIAGLVFTALAPSRAKAKETVCAGNLKQIYHGLLAYAADWGESPHWPELSPICPVRNTTIAFRDVYIGNRSVMFCPATDPVDREGWASSYAWPIAGRAMCSGERENMAVRMFVEQLERLGSSTPIVRCAVKDRVYYLPRERNADPKLLGRYELHLLISGAVRSTRVDAPRGSSLTPW